MDKNLSILSRNFGQFLLIFFKDLLHFTMIFKKNLKNLLKIGGKFTQWNFQEPKNQIQLTDPSLLYYVWIEWQKLQLHFKFFLKEILLCKIKWVFPFSYKNSTIQLYVAEAIQFIIKKRFQSSFKKRWETFFCIAFYVKSKIPLTKKNSFKVLRR